MNVHDAFGRRIRNTHTTISSNGVQNTRIVQFWYDPDFEFMQLGFSVNGKRFWRVHGPDLNGAYAGLQGIGGLEAIVEEQSGVTTVLVNDFFGNVVATNIYIDGLTAVPAFLPNRYTSYGPLEGYQTPALSLNVPVATAFGWLGKAVEPTGKYDFHRRFYDPIERRFISMDPLGFSGGNGSYGFCNNNPIYYYDPDGMAPQPYNPNNPATWRLPQGGTGYWTGQPGNSTFVFRSDAPQFKTFGGRLTYMNGVPDFSPWQVNPTIGGTTVAGRINIEVTGEHGTDRARAIAEIAERNALSIEEVKTAVEGYQFHHFQANEVVLVPKDINEGISHIGPASAARAATAAAESASWLDRAGTVTGKLLKALGILAIADAAINPGDAIGAAIAGPVMTFGDATKSGEAMRILSVSTDPQARLAAYLTLQGLAPDGGSMTAADVREFADLRMTYDSSGQDAPSDSILDRWSQGLALGKK